MRVPKITLYDDDAHTDTTTTRFEQILQVCVCGVFKSATIKIFLRARKESVANLMRARVNNKSNCMKINLHQLKLIEKNKNDEYCFKQYEYVHD